MNDVFWLSLIVFLPSVGALVIAFLDKEKPGPLRVVALATTALTFLLSVGVLILPVSSMSFDTTLAEMQNRFSIDLISQLSWIS